MTCTQTTTPKLLNPCATLQPCDRCGENPRRFIVGSGVTEVHLCALCGVRQSLDDLPEEDAYGLQALRLRWIGTPNPETDVDDATFDATHYQDRDRMSADDDVMVERVARMEFMEFVAMLEGALAA